MVQYNISVGFVTCSKDYYLVVFVGFLEAFDGIGSDVNSCLDRIPVRKSDINYLVAGVVFNIIDAVN